MSMREILGLCLQGRGEGGRVDGQEVCVLPQPSSQRVSFLHPLINVPAHWCFAVCWPESPGQLNGCPLGPELAAG